MSIPSLHPESYFETILHKPGAVLHSSALENPAPPLCCRTQLNLGTMTTIPTRLPPIPPPQRKGWPCIHAAVNSVSYSRAQRVTGLSLHPQNSQFLPPLTPIKSLATIVLLSLEWWIQLVHTGEEKWQGKET